MLGPRTAENSKPQCQHARQRPHLDARGPSTTSAAADVDSSPTRNILLYMLNGVRVHICCTRKAEQNQFRVHIGSTSIHIGSTLLSLLRGKTIRIKSVSGPHRGRRSQPHTRPDRVHIWIFVFSNFFAFSCLPIFLILVFLQLPSFMDSRVFQFSAFSCLPIFIISVFSRFCDFRLLWIFVFSHFLLLRVHQFS